MGYPIYIDPQVEASIGAAVARLARNPMQPTYKCAGCGRQASFSQPSCLVMLTPPGMPPILRYAERACMTSSVQPGSPRQSPDQDAEMKATAGFLQDSGGGLRAVLIVEPVARLVGFTSAGDPVEALLAYLQRLGLRLLAGLTAPAPPAADWTLEMPGPDHARVLGPAGAVLYEGGITPPAGWHAAVTAAGRAELLCGIIGLAAAEQAGGAAQLRALHEAARAGMLVAGTVAVPGASAGARSPGAGLGPAGDDR
jgi:hypothetical protein